MTSIIVSASLFLYFAIKCHASGTDIALDAKATLLHRIDSLNLLIYTCLLTLTVLTIWVFKHRRVSWLHETGLAVIYGLIVGAIIRYAGSTNQVTHIDAFPAPNTKYNLSVPPDIVRFHFPDTIPISPGEVPVPNKTYAYSFRGEIVNLEQNEIDLKATFDPEIFFNIILPPIIFHAGYCLKRKYFFRNLGAILTFAMVGTALSALVIGALMYGCVQLMPASLAASFTFLDTLYFGALISPTDPLTVLAIFSQLKVDVNLYAMIFGESVLNDAVALVLSGAIQNYEKRYSVDGGFEITAFLAAIGDFIGIFSLSLLVGAFMGCLTALISKFTHVRDWPLLESALFVLMSYAAFLIAEVCELTGVVAVLFCGICQAHYTYNNLSSDSRNRTKQLFELLNFLAENFIFTYIGVSMFTFPKHHFDPWFIIAGFLTSTLGRAVNIYPLSFLLNLGRKPPIPVNFQHMLFFSGLRGAMSFALAIRNTVSEARQAMLTTTSLIVIATVVLQGGAASHALAYLRIPTGQGQNDENEALPYRDVRSLYQATDTGGPNGRMVVKWDNGDSGVIMPWQINSYEDTPHGNETGEKARLARLWGAVDSKLLKPLLTHARPPLTETLPAFLSPVARLLTTTRQYTQGYSPCLQDGLRRTDSDSDLCIDEPQPVPTSIDPQQPYNIRNGYGNV
ncbi:sodium/hydrogen exchanger 6 isoform X4 [Danaus plexippus]|uniref:sodium/hydrogen exchanger 6 isoform X4 n=1 Tax=Danaus plexippus TaxID=13037 RepID=UPI002AB0281F|nr:sodium/hydrogen exchanger 6 isoform X4 [Danaus plexippus]XP_061385777.1 sodium/hydrogen exchanger 6 isoform X4 [Danaus plexippus]